MNAENPPIAILPLGATEQHGPHLPPETDAIIAEAIALRLAERMQGPLRMQAAMVLEILPVEKLGYSIEHADDCRTHSLDYEDAARRWISIGEDCAARGIRKMLLLNAHGGNSPLLTIVATELRVRRAMLCVATSWTRFGTPPGLVSEQEKAFGIHGGFIETSVMLALRPDLVDMTKAQDFPSAQQDFASEFKYLRAYGPHAFGWKMSDLSPAGVVGNAALANAQAGESILSQAVAGLADLLIDIDHFNLARLS